MPFDIPPVIPPVVPVPDGENEAGAVDDAGFVETTADAGPVESVPVDGEKLAGAPAGAAGFVMLSIFFKVSSTSAAAQPAPTSAAFIASRETPSLVCEEIYSTS